MAQPGHKALLGLETCIDFFRIDHTAMTCFGHPEMQARLVSR
jgi:hypothetical protein